MLTSAWGKTQGKETDGLMSCFPILQYSESNRWQVNIDRYGKTQKISIHSSDPMIGQQLLYI